MSQTFAPSAIEPWLEIVRQKVAAMRFGSVQIVVHEGRVTQVESTEKTRFGADEVLAPRMARAAHPRACLSFQRWIARRSNG